MAVKVSAVSYLNTKPFLYGLMADGIDQSMDLSLDIPAHCAQKLQDGVVDLGLVPVAVIPEIPNAQIISDYCIGAVGAVRTVCIYAQQPLETLTHLYLDHHSRTSAALTRYLLANYWKKEVNFLEAKEGFINQIQGSVGGLVIGDRTIGLENRFAYNYDLSAVWNEATGQPFVFAAWVACRALPEKFLNRFNKALALGVDRRIDVAAMFQSCYPDFFSVQEYYTKYIDYQLDDSKKAALKFFLNNAIAEQNYKLSMH